MKGTIIGFEPVDYPKKDNPTERVKGIDLTISHKSANVFGLAAKVERIKADKCLFQLYRLQSEKWL